MPPLLLWSLIFILGLVLLIYFSDIFIRSSERIGLYLGVSPFIVGVTLVAAGTSLPELLSSIVAAIQGAPEMVVGNVAGSNTANIFLVLGLGALVAGEIKIEFDILHTDMPLLLASAFLLMAACWDGEVSRGEGIMLLLGGGIYLVYVARTGQAQQGLEGLAEIEPKEKRRWGSAILGLLAGGVFIALGAQLTVDSVIRIADILQVGKDVVAMTAVAFGTSLPELVVTWKAARKGQVEMAAGNVLGSNIFNTFAVTGIPALFTSLPVPDDTRFLALPASLVATILFWAIIQNNHVSRWEGSMLVLFYAFFIGKVTQLI